MLQPSIYTFIHVLATLSKNIQDFETLNEITAVSYLFSLHRVESTWYRI